MARKSSGDSANQQTDNGQSALSPSKPDAVKEALAQGISSPTKIAEYLKTMYGLDITPAYVSTIKTTLKKKKKGKGRQPGRPPRAEKAMAQQPVAQPLPAPKAGSLTPQDLRALSEIASRAGGFGRLREFIDVLGDVR